MNTQHETPFPVRRRPARRALVLGAAVAALGPAALAMQSVPPAPAPAPASRPAASAPATRPPAVQAPATPAASLEQARLTLGKWIETQQIISKERNDWQQGKEILAGRVELVGKEVSVLRERIAQSEAAVAESDRKKQELQKRNDELKATTAQLAAAVVAMEAEVRKLARMMPEHVATKMQPLLQRIPSEGAQSRVSTAERFQNVLGILNELNRANSEITVAYEVRTLADGSSSEVQVIYVGLASAYYISPRGEAGVGRPGPDGWSWRPVPDAADDILLALEVIQGKHVPTFVPLPISLQ
jgi:hypothetical protein